MLSRVGRRGAALLFFALLDLISCYRLLTAPHPLTPFYAWMDTIVPLPVWAGCWAAVGLICLVFAFLVYDTPAFMAAVALKVGWGLLALRGWQAGVVEGGYFTAVVWLAFAGFVFLIAGGIPAPYRPRRGWRSWTRSSVPR